MVDGEFQYVVGPSPGTRTISEAMLSDGAIARASRSMSDPDYSNYGSAPEPPSKGSPGNPQVFSWEPLGTHYQRGKRHDVEG